MEDLNKLEESAFDSFDPDAFDEVDSFDPDLFTGKRDKKQQGRGQRIFYGQQASFDITIESNVDEDRKIELFNYMRSFAFVKNSDYTTSLGVPKVFGLDYPYTVDPITDAISAGVGGDTMDGIYSRITQNAVFFDQEGNLLFVKRITGTTYSRVKVSCKQIPYRSLMLSSALQPFVIDKMRIRFTADYANAQMQEEITRFENTFLGAVKANNISPSQYFSPNQFQDYIVDIPTTLKIDMNSGLRWNIKGKTTSVNNLISINIRVRQYWRNTV